MIRQHRWVLIAAVMWIASGPQIGTARADIQVNTYTTGDQRIPSVSLDADGDFVVVWRSDGSFGTDSSEFSIQGQRYASDGATVGGQFQVNTYTTSRQWRASVALDGDGDFVVVWDSAGSFGTDSESFSIQGQRYASDGAPVGGQFQVNTYTTSGQEYSSVALDADGDFVVVWHSYGGFGTDTDGASIQGQRYASDGATVGGQFQVNTYAAGSPPFHLAHPSVALDADGDFVVVWTGIIQGSPRIGIQGQRYASEGATVGGEFQVNSNTAGNQYRPSVALDTDGNFVVVWYGFGSYGTDSSQASIQGQRYALDGVTVGGQFQVNTYTTSGQGSPLVALGVGGDFVVVWESLGSGGTDTDEFSIQMRSFPGEIFADGFESGDTSAWSSVVGD